MKNLIKVDMAGTKSMHSDAFPEVKRAGFDVLDGR
jgi:hypothetical protein